MSKDLVHETSITTGTGSFTLDPVNGKVSFSDSTYGFGTGATTNVFQYFISNRAAAEWEIGFGHMSDSTTLVRDTVELSSNSNAAVNFSAGIKDVTNDIRSFYQDSAVLYNADKTLAAGYLSTIKFTYGTSGTINLSPLGGNLQGIFCQGTMTLNSPTDSGVYTMVVFLYNDTGASTKTIANFRKVTGDSLDNTVGHGFLLFITRSWNDNAWVHCHVQALF
jgi:hypothetical protein